MDRFIKPTVVRLNLTHGDYIDVKKRLNTGEEHDLFARMVDQHMAPGETPKLIAREVMIARVVAYLLNWSFTDNGTPVPVSESAIRNLDPDTFREIKDAIDTHVEIVTAEIELAKKNLSGEAEWRGPSPFAAP